MHQRHYTKPMVTVKIIVMRMIMPVRLLPESVTYRAQLRKSRFTNPAIGVLKNNSMKNCNGCNSSISKAIGSEVMMSNLFWVATGGALGAMARYGMGMW